MTKHRWHLLAAVAGGVVAGALIAAFTGIPAVGKLGVRSTVTTA
jgi:hypothetical protein